jgi:hypothetical protein
MKKKITTIILALVFAASAAWAAVADGIVALIPLFICICCGIRILVINSDYVRNY